ncbi:hypothetical protein KL912_002465 [Ogataea haglerorum]|nr:hypothetical protein KL912_002465 [Ogataea haglerorum]
MQRLQRRLHEVPPGKRPERDHQLPDRGPQSDEMRSQRDPRPQHPLQEGVRAALSMSQLLQHGAQELQKSRVAAQRLRVQEPPSAEARSGRRQQRGVPAGQPDLPAAVAAPGERARLPPGHSRLRALCLSHVLGIYLLSKHHSA